MSDSSRLNVVLVCTLITAAWVVAVTAAAVTVYRREREHIMVAIEMYHEIIQKSVEAEERIRESIDDPKQGLRNLERMAAKFI